MRVFINILLIFLTYNSQCQSLNSSEELENRDVIFKDFGKSNLDYEKVKILSEFYNVDESNFSGAIYFRELDNNEINFYTIDYKNFKNPDVLNNLSNSLNKKIKIYYRKYTFRSKEFYIIEKVEY